jgi:hypothetical protein
MPRKGWSAVHSTAAGRFGCRRRDHQNQRTARRQPAIPLDLFLSGFMRGRRSQLQASPCKMVEPAAIDHDDAGHIHPDRKFGAPKPRTNLAIRARGLPATPPRCRPIQSLADEAVAFGHSIRRIADEDRATPEPIVEERPFCA